MVLFLLERDSRIKDMQERQTKLEANNKQLQVEEQALREKVDKVCFWMLSSFS